jgi:hypothetical protein
VFGELRFVTNIDVDGYVAAVAADVPSPRLRHRAFST